MPSPNSPPGVLELVLDGSRPSWDVLAEALERRNGRDNVLVVRVSGALSTTTTGPPTTRMAVLGELASPSVLTVLVLERDASGSDLLALAVAADLRLADAEARVGPGELALGLVPWIGVAAKVASAAPQARWLAALSSDGLSAPTARDLGLLDRVVETPQLNDMLQSVVEQAAAIDRGLLAEAKALFSTVEEDHRQQHDAWTRWQKQRDGGIVG